MMDEQKLYFTNSVFYNTFDDITPILDKSLEPDYIPQIIEDIDFLLNDSIDIIHNIENCLSMDKDTIERLYIVFNSLYDIFNTIYISSFRTNIEDVYYGLNIKYKKMFNDNMSSYNIKKILKIKIILLNNDLFIRFINYCKDHYKTFIIENNKDIITGHICKFIKYGIEYEMSNIKTSLECNENMIEK
jgi:hypothetical protein